MANLGYIHTKTSLSKKKILPLVEEFNKTFFNNTLKFDYVKEERLFVLSHPKLESPRMFWIEHSKKLEVRHGCGSQFAWWIDTLLRHFLASKLDGVITDDGFNERVKGTPEKYLSFKQYMIESFGEEKGIYFYNLEKKDFELTEH